jgi:rhomboid family protein
MGGQEVAGGESAATSGGGASSVPWWRRPLRVVPVIIGINVVVFLAWQLSKAVPHLRGIMVINFLTSPLHLEHGLYWTLLTSVFSHAELWHLAINMIVLYSFGAVLERLWGPRTFLGFYLAAGILASVSHCAVTQWLLSRGNVSALGASGAISGLLLAYALIFPRHKILVLGIIPVPAAAGVVAFVGLDVWGLIAQTRGGGLPIGHGAHLGGAAAGAVLYLLFIRPKLAARRGYNGAGMPPALTREESRRLERLHSKVEEEGRESLTPEDRLFLHQLRERFRDVRGGS